MAFANPLPLWLLALAAAAAAATAWQAYRGLGTRRRRYTLTGLRFVTLVLLVVFLMRPVAHRPAAEARDAIVPILVDTSRSMAIVDAGGQRRIDRARQIVTGTLLPALDPHFHAEVLAFGEALAPASPSDLSSTGRRSDLRSAIAGVRERYRGRAVAGIILLSDGGDTSGDAERAAADVGLAIYPLGVGSRSPARDREILSVTAVDTVLDDSRVDLAVSAVSHGDGTAPIELRLLENGRPIEVRRPVPAADGAPVRETFQVSPERGAATVYTVETPALAGEIVPENNARSVLVQLPLRPRRVLLVEGAPGFEHSFLKRALAGDSGLDVDSVVRKGRNEQGSDTFYIQAARSRSDNLTAGFPTKHESLFAYDAIVLANVEAAQLSRAELDATREFVARRGGGLLVLGARSFLRQGILETSLEEVLPLQMGARGDAAGPASASRGLNRIVLTAEGEMHPIMQLAAGPGETRRRWDTAPSLASIASLGGPRPGASVLAVTGSAGGATRALVAVQRFGEGRSMVFTGEAAWRWRMLRPSSDRSYETFWRQSIRWLSLPAPEPIAVTVPVGASPGDSVALRIAARDAAFEPLRDVTVEVRVTGPDGRVEPVRADADFTAGDGRFVATIRPTRPGVYKVIADVHRREAIAGTATSSMLVGGTDPEMTDPRVNVALLQRIALASGGRVLDEANLASLAGSLAAAAPAARLAMQHDLWHTGWSFAAILVLLASEWILRRRWGMR